MTRPHDDDDALSAIVLGGGAGGVGGKRSPGVVTLSGHDREKNWDTKAAKGQAGATEVLNGDPIGTFTASFYLADDGANPGEPTDFDQWEDYQRLIESTTNGPKPVALPIYHPDLARNHFTEVVSGGVGGLVHDGKGGATVKVKFREYKPAKPKPAAKATVKKVMSDPHGDPNGANDPNAQRKAELAALVAEARKP